MNFFDCFMYNNEETLLDLRLQTLSKYVRKFILVESIPTRTTSAIVSD